VLVTSGPTREAMDHVRFIGNRSSGRMGQAVASAAWLRGAEVVLVTDPTGLAPPTGVDVVRVETAQEMFDAVEAHLPELDVSVFAAAVGDFRPAHPRDAKLKRTRTGDLEPVHLVPNPDIARDTRHLR